MTATTMHDNNGCPLGTTTLEAWLAPLLHTRGCFHTRHGAIILVDIDVLHECVGLRVTMSPVTKVCTLVLARASCALHNNRPPLLHTAPAHSLRSSVANSTAAAVPCFFEEMDTPWWLSRFKRNGVNISEHESGTGLA